jgi:phosphoribosylamine--glycine ligase
MLAITRGESIAGTTLEWTPGAAVATVLASGGYPGDYPTGIPIHISPEVERMDGVVLFHAGTRAEDGALVTSGGRVLAVTALAPTVAEAAERSRAAAERIRYEGRHFRRDIGWREVARRGSHA